MFSRQFVKETTVDTDLQILIPDHYVGSLTERLLLYRELDNILKEEDLLQFETNLRDRFGPLPDEVMELINVVRMRKKAQMLGFEKLILKNKKMLAYFVSKRETDYFESPFFQAVLAFVQKYPNLCTLKEQNNKLCLIIEDVVSVKRSQEILANMESLALSATAE
jgi:transcription-repair coupling factor (superfamily II helicase)